MQRAQASTQAHAQVPQSQPENVQLILIPSKVFQVVSIWCQKFTNFTTFGMNLLLLISLNHQFEAHFGSYFSMFSKCQVLWLGEETSHGFASFAPHKGIRCRFLVRPHHWLNVCSWWRRNFKVCNGKRRNGTRGDPTAMDEIW